MNIRREAVSGGVSTSIGMDSDTGTKSAARDQHTRRRAEALDGKKFPDEIRARSVLFSEIAKVALEYSKDEKRSYYSDTIRMGRLVAEFGSQRAESIKREEVEQWLNLTAKERQWSWPPRTVISHC